MWLQIGGAGGSCCFLGSQASPLHHVRLLILTEVCSVPSPSNFMGKNCQILEIFPVSLTGDLVEGQIFKCKVQVKMSHWTEL